MRLRYYQRDAIAGAREAWKEHQSTLMVIPTAGGKTVTFAHLAKETPGRVMVVSQREELVFQAANKIREISGEDVDIEMADFQADLGSGSWFKGFDQRKYVSASVQTLNAGSGDGRISKFNPNDFGLLICDEAHHGVSSTHRFVLQHFRSNRNCKILGVTATPDRADKEALGQVFESVAFDYEILDAITDGFLVPVLQQVVNVEGLDLSSVRTTAGDLNGADLAEVMEYEKNLLEMASATLD